MQAGARRYPEPPLPRQHERKPGAERDIDPAPLYDAPFYLGSSKLHGKVALITGGDSGIGRAVAVLFAREGADVAIQYLCEHADAEATRTAVEAEGRRAILVPGDVSRRSFCEQAVRRTVDELGGIDVLVNNAAFQAHVPRLEDLSEEHLELTLKTNLHGYFYMAQAAVPHMKAGAAIVNTGSVTGIEGSGHLLDYATTKGGIHAMTRSLATHLMPRGIRVNAVSPGFIQTPTLGITGASVEELAAFEKEGNAITPMGRIGTPDEVARAALFLAFDATFTTGTELPVDGGLAQQLAVPSP